MPVPEARGGARETGVRAAGYHLPGPPVDLREWGAEQGVVPARIARLIENGCRHFHVGPEHSDLELIEAAMEHMDLPDNGWKRGTRYLVHAHTQTFSVPPAPHSLLADLVARHGFDLSLCLSISHLACASAIAAIDCAARLLEADPAAESALVVTSDRVFGGPRYRLQGNGSIQSDGASALLIGREQLRCRLGASSFSHFAGLHDGPCTPAAAFSMTRQLGQHMLRGLRRHEAQTGQPLASYGCILPANTDRPDWETVAIALGLPVSRFHFDNIGRRGHACCADFAVNLVDAGFDAARAGKQVLAFGQSNIGAFAALSLLPPGARAEEPSCH